MKFFVSIVLCLAVVQAYVIRAPAFTAYHDAPYSAHPAVVSVYHTPHSYTKYQKNAHSAPVAYSAAQVVKTPAYAAPTDIHAAAPHVYSAAPHAYSDAPHAYSPAPASVKTVPSIYGPASHAYNAIPQH